MRCLFAFLTVCALAACDTGSVSGPVVFSGVEVTPRGEAQLSVDGGVLVVSGLTGDRAGGFAVNRSLARLDVETSPVTVPAGGRFGVVVEDANGQPIAQMYNEANGTDGLRASTLRFAFVDGVRAARITYRLGGQVVFVIPSIELTASGGRFAQQGSAGEADGKSGSVHVIRNANGQYVVVSDAEDSAKQAGPGVCGGFTILPPIDLPRAQFPEGTLCADWVEVEPLGGPAPLAARMAVMARSVDSFRVQTLVATD